MVRPRKDNNTVSLEEVPVPTETLIEEAEQKSELTFVVTRGGLRVSDQTYNSAKDPVALAERDFWQRIVEMFPDDSKVEIVPFDKKRHRIY